MQHAKLLVASESHDLAKGASAKSESVLTSLQNFIQGHQAVCISESFAAILALPRNAVKGSPTEMLTSACLARHHQ